jgi:hypothetical protein
LPSRQKKKSEVKKYRIGCALSSHTHREEKNKTSVGSIIIVIFTVGVQVAARVGQFTTKKERNHNLHGSAQITYFVWPKGKEGERKLTKK